MADLKIFNPLEWSRSAILNSEGKQEIVQHSHINSVDVHLHLSSVTASQDYILVDLSDSDYTISGGTEFVRLENLWFDIDADNTADYSITLGYLKNVFASAGTFTHLYTLSGDKTAGQSRNVFVSMYPNGAKMQNGFVVTADNITEAGFGSGSTMPTTLLPLPLSGTTNPGNGDVVLRIIRNAGTFALSTNLSFHTH